MRTFGRAADRCAWATACGELAFAGRQPKSERAAPARVAPGSNGALAARVARGRYLVSHAAACGECHSPRKAAGEYDRTRWLAGVDCFLDVAPTIRRAAASARAT